MDTTQSHTILIVSSELDVAQAVSRLGKLYPIQHWQFIYLLEDLLGQAGEAQKREGTFIIRDFAVHAEVEAKFEQIASMYAVTAAIPNDEFAVWIAAWANDRWQLPGLTFDVAARFRDKKRMKQIAQQAGIPTAREISMDAIHQGEATFPLVLKPRSLAGSVGVRIISDASQLAAVSIAGSDEYRDMDEQQYFIESYNPQPLYQIDAVVLQGRLAFLSVGEYIGKPIDYLNECPLGYLSVTDDHLQRFWRPFTAKILSAFDGPDGVYHIEAFGDAGEGAELLEIAFRPGSGSTIEMIQFAWGLNPDLGLVHLAAQLGLVGDVHFGRQAEAYGYMMFPKRHLAEETLYVTEVALPGIDRVPTLKMHKTRHRGDIASGEFYCHKDSLGVFVFSGDRSGVARDLKRIVEEYRVYAGPRQADCQS
ncbi:ATP-grasp domain-containing protein [Erwinia pyrifoliae]|uniref:ATP-grasp domain-containing protein n=1 Tax=Erwinia pyrifoliae TaxID=79967 RepID=UPI0001961256|nr:HPr kinase [Erwinia pyrifoliae]CAX56878.1 hrp/hrc Type III secretion system-Hrp-associated systemic virulence protein C [Erwinia pyrifoliae Ep1/96]CAY75726.1 hrp-associated systemic virulence protein HsvC [Erwinia pyrifoliae DSM 12163]